MFQANFVVLKNFGGMFPQVIIRGDKIPKMIQAFKYGILASPLPTA
jgi:hypothetical protein